MMQRCFGCGMEWSIEFEKQYPEVVEKFHLESHPAELDALRLKAHIENELDRLLGEEE